jgi:hypothetical protein
VPTCGRDSRLHRYACPLNVDMGFRVTVYILHMCCYLSTLSEGGKIEFGLEATQPSTAD